METPRPSAVWSDRFRVRAVELDDRWRLRPASLCDYLQEAAAAHAHALGVSVEALHPRGLTWVLSRFHVRAASYPRWRAEVVVETWPSAVSGPFALRDFRVLDSDGLPLAAATSSWMVIDIAKRKPVPLPDFILSIHGPNPGRAVDDPFAVLPPLPEAAERSLVLEIRRADLDLNRHLNFVKTIELGLEAVPPDVVVGRELRDLEVAFRAEGWLGDRVVSRSAALDAGEPRKLGHALFRESDGRELARMTSTWAVPGGRSGRGAGGAGPEGSLVI
jgi:acyl-ACP thioesterase